MAKKVQGNTVAPRVARNTKMNAKNINKTAKIVTKANTKTKKVKKNISNKKPEQQNITINEVKNIPEMKKKSIRNKKNVSSSAVMKRAKKSKSTNIKMFSTNAIKRIMSQKNGTEVQLSQKSIKSIQDMLQDVSIALCEQAKNLQKSSRGKTITESGIKAATKIIFPSSFFNKADAFAANNSNIKNVMHKKRQNRKAATDAEVNPC